MSRFLSLHLLLFLLLSFEADSQSRSQDTLDLDSFLEIVTSNHPLVKKANLYDEMQAAYELKGKGVLDPKVSSVYDSKDFDQTDYFTVWQTEAKVPTTLPIDFSVGYERNDGAFLNQENSVPSNGLIYGTLNISLIRGLLYDEQRYQIQAAKLNGVKSQIEKDLLVREIIYQAILSYIYWTQASQELKINESYLQLVKIRHQNIVQLYLNGDKPAIDTLESRLNVNSAEKLNLKSQDKLIKAVQKLSLFLWDVDSNPLSMNKEVLPMSFNSLLDNLETKTQLFNPVLANDPLIQKYDNQINLLNLENRLEKENLKPQLDLKYNTIVNLGKDEFSPSFTLNDYKYGLVFQYPILNRKAKAQIRLNQSIIAQNEFDKTNYLGTLLNKLEALYQRQTVQTEMVEFSKEKVDFSDQLYEAEQLKFEIGESSIFLLNQRERKLLESQIELIQSYFTLGQILNEFYYLKLGQL